MIASRASSFVVATIGGLFVLAPVAADAQWWRSAPYDFESFEHRRFQAAHRSRVAGWSAAAALGVLTVVPLLAVLTQQEPAARVLASPVSAVKPTAEIFLQPPALVDMDRFVITSALEDHIALLDAEISIARVTPVPREQLRRLESARSELSDSLQHVTYAHALLDL